MYPKIFSADFSKVKIKKISSQTKKYSFSIIMLVKKICKRRRVFLVL